MTGSTTRTTPSRTTRTGWLAGAVAALVVPTLAACSVGVDPGRDDGSPGPSGTGSIDPCLVGRWSTVEQTDAVDAGDEQLVATGVPRVLDLSADGVETVVYGEAAAAVTREDGSVAGELTHTGTFRFRVVTDGSTITFTGLDGEVEQVLVLDGERYVSTLSPTSPPVEYTCDGDRMTQQSEGYSAVFERAG